MKNQLKTGLWLLVMWVVAPMVSADTLGLHLGVGSWQNEADGDVISGLVPGDTSNLGLDDESATFFYIKFEHPVPMLPNLRLAQSEATSTGSVTYPSLIGSTTVKTEIDLDHTDYTLYWEVIDTGMDLDIGLTGRRFDGALTQELTFVGGPANVVDTQPIEGTIPMLYIHARAELPFSGFYVGGEINSLSYKGDGFNDLTLKLGWSTDNWIMPEFGVEAGYRKFSLDIDQTNSLDTSLDLSIDGYYLALVGHF